MNSVFSTEEIIDLQEQTEKTVEKLKKENTKKKAN
jgi:hypothetical protein